MIFNSSKGIILEQNKEPALSKGISTLPGFDIKEEFITLKEDESKSIASPNGIIAIAKEARIIDETDGNLLWKKLVAASRAEVKEIVVDAIDDEPYISSQIGPLLHFPTEIVEGLNLAKRVLGATSAHIEVYKNLFDLEVRIPNTILGVEVKKVSGAYPVEYRAKRKSLIKNTLVIGACALLHLKRAVFENRVQNTCFVTIAGDCIGNIGNYEVPIGTSVLNAISSAVLIQPPRRIVVGGAMTGFSITNPNSIFVSPQTMGILVFAKEFKKLDYSCIGCGRCTEVCPEGLSPYMIYRIMSTKDKKKLILTDANRCTACGTCSYVCPAKLDLMQSVTEASRRLNNVKVN